MFIYSLIRHVPGMGLDTKNTAGTMELRLTFPSEPLLPLSISDLGWTAFLGLPQTLCVYLYHNTGYKTYFTNLFPISFQAEAVFPFIFVYLCLANSLGFYRYLISLSFSK